jgi:hypothetical protein
MAVVVTDKIRGYNKIKIVLEPRRGSTLMIREQDDERSVARDDDQGTER